MNESSGLFEERPAEVSRPDRRRLLRGLALLLLLFVTTRLPVWVATYSGPVMFFRVRHGIEQVGGPRRAEILARVVDPQRPEYATYRDHLADFGPLSKFDGQYYKSIVVDGYRYIPAGMDDHFSARAQNIAFFFALSVPRRPVIV